MKKHKNGGCSITESEATKIVGAIDALNARCAWQAAMLEEAKGLIRRYEDLARSAFATDWIEKYKKGPQ